MWAGPRLRRRPPLSRRWAVPGAGEATAATAAPDAEAETVPPAEGATAKTKRFPAVAKSVRGGGRIDLHKLLGLSGSAQCLSSAKTPFRSQSVAAEVVEATTVRASLGGRRVVCRTTLLRGVGPGHSKSSTTCTVKPPQKMLSACEGGTGRNVERKIIETKG